LRWKDEKLFAAIQEMAAQHASARSRYREELNNSSITLSYHQQDIPSGETIPLNLTHQTPMVEWLMTPGHVYTLIMYDYDAPNPPYLHWLVSEIQPGRERVLVPYEPPNPPGNEIHTYTIEVFRQPREGTDQRVKSLSRRGFPLDAFIRRHHLQSIGATSFQTGHRAASDGYWMSEAGSPEAGQVFNGRRFPEEYNDFEPYFGHPENFYTIDEI
jgi:phosphatidylethanolamine-binding protein (PEBP) family uncharacterized protein